MTTKRLYRSNSDKMIGGICGGIAEYLNMDPTIVRIIWILLVFFGGSGILLYIVGLIIIPLNPNESPKNPEEKHYQNRNSFTFFIGILFLLAGSFILLHNIGFIPYRFWHHGWDLMFALGLIGFGVYLFLRSPADNNSGPDEGSDFQDGTDGHERNRYSNKTLYKSVTDRKLFGVCAGIADYLNLDPTIVRVGWVLFVFVSIGLAILLYIILGLVLPEKKLANS